MDHYKLDLRRFYSEQRDKHLEQLMNINGKAAFGSLALLVSVIAGVLKKEFVPKFDSPLHVIGYIFIAVSIIALATAIALYSKFHTSRISSLEKLIQKPEDPDSLSGNEFCIFPSGKNSGFINYLVFIGLCIMFLGVLLLLI